MVSRQHEVLLRFLEAYNAADDDGLDALFTPDYVHHNNDDTFTLAGFKRGAAWFRAGLPDFRAELQDAVESGDRIAMRFTATGTHRASLFGEQPTGRTIHLHVMLFCRFVDGLIAEDWEIMDEGDLRRQVGPIPAER